MKRLISLVLALSLLIAAASKIRSSMENYISPHEIRKICNFMTNGRYGEEIKQYFKNIQPDPINEERWIIIHPYSDVQSIVLDISSPPLNLENLSVEFIKSQKPTLEEYEKEFGDYVWVSRGMEDGESRVKFRDITTGSQKECRIFMVIDQEVDGRRILKIEVSTQW